MDLRASLGARIVFLQEKGEHGQSGQSMVRCVFTWSSRRQHLPIWRPRLTVLDSVQMDWERGIDVSTAGQWTGARGKGDSW
jgi:hypothetical protein